VIVQYDGVVIVHGTDTMADTASAVAMLLGPLPKPAVLTGSQKPLDEPRTDARSNLIAAALVATLPVPEVTIAMGSHALRGARATKRDAWGFDAFDSQNQDALVELGLGVISRRTFGRLRPSRRTTIASSRVCSPCDSRDSIQSSCAAR